jgi:hypothetical protein
MAGKFYWNASGVSVQGTLPNNGTWNLAAGNNPAGVYDGSVTNAPAASAVCSLTTVNGVAGTAVCQGLAGGTVASTADVMAGKFYWNASGVSVQGTLPNNGTWNLAAGSNPAGVYDGSVTNAPAASAVCSLTTVNGVPGTAICDVGGHLNSTLARTKGTAIISQKEEIAAGSLPSGYREIPNVALDSDGHGGSEVTKASRPTTACGMTQATLDARIADCVTRNAGNATWNGATHGIGGEGTWSLVTAFLPAGANGDPCAGLCEEVWRDNRTGLVWSDWLGSASNTRSTWCPASGNVENVGVNCLPGAGQQPNPAQSWCAESAGLTTPSTYDPEKGGMRATATGTSPSVRWRLPTRRDFMMADLNGLRFVVPHSTSYYWTSTLYSGNDDRAWRFEGDYGQVFYDAQLYGGDGVIADDRTSSQSRVRCVGR